MPSVDKRINSYTTHGLVVLCLMMVSLMSAGPAGTPAETDGGVSSASQADRQGQEEEGTMDADNWQIARSIYLASQTGRRQFRPYLDFISVIKWCGEQLGIYKEEARYFRGYVGGFGGHNAPIEFHGFRGHTR